MYGCSFPINLPVVFISGVNHHVTHKSLPTAMWTPVPWEYSWMLIHPKPSMSMCAMHSCITGLSRKLGDRTISEKVTIAVSNINEEELEKLMYDSWIYAPLCIPQSLHRGIRRGTLFLLCISGTSYRYLPRCPYSLGIEDLGAQRLGSIACAYVSDFHGHVLALHNPTNMLRELFLLLICAAWIEFAIRFSPQIEVRSISIRYSLSINVM